MSSVTLPTSASAQYPDFAVVGIGASAGGVQALLRFFENAPAPAGMAFVVVLHLSPDYASQAHTVIQRATHMPVSQVLEPTPIEKDHVYVIPPGRHLSMIDGYLRVSGHDVSRVPPTSIDVFFRSLADAHGSRAVGVVLSGTGADGSVGLGRVRERGGITIVQDPDEAEYGEMPRNALATGMIDLTLPVSQMAARIAELAGKAAQIQLPPASDDVDAGQHAAQPEGSALDAVLALLHERTGHDFSNYKQGTILRRIERRLQVNGLPNIDAYRDFLAGEVDETPKLLADLLIGVTNFFRDQDAFAALERVLQQDLARAGSANEEYRAWIPGCATGEEAYSVAMLLAEGFHRTASRNRLAIFATDVDERAIGIARMASYPSAIANDVTPERVAKFFVTDGSRLRIAKALRETIIFAAHNILRDPPFSRLDLISCRNLLIYLDRKAQTYALSLFHFALRPGGILFLGTAESADFAPDRFEVIDRKHRIYRALPAGASARFGPLDSMWAGTLTGRSYFPVPEPPRAHPPLTLPPPVDRPSEAYGPPWVVVRPDGTIVQRTATAARLLVGPTHERAGSLLDVVEPGSRERVRKALDESTRCAGRYAEDDVPLLTAHGRLPFDLTMRRFRHGLSNDMLLSVTLDAVGEPTADLGATVDESQGSLYGSEEWLQTTLTLAQTSREELRASNEELQAMNEELRSTTEELEASKEELQSLNEELLTVNSELQAKAQESAKVSDDLRNLITLVGVATVFVDRLLHIKRFTSPAESLFNIIPSDIGRSLLDLVNRLDYPELEDDLNSAFEHLRKTEREVRSHDGRWLLARVLPYRTDDDRIDGAILALVDITERRKAQQEARLSEERLRMAAQATHDFAIIVTDEEGNIVSWNAGAQRIFGFVADEVMGGPLDLIFTSADREAGVPALERDRARAGGRAEDERWHATKGGGRVYCSGYLSRIAVAGFSGFAKIVHDATDRKMAEGRQLRKLAQEREDRARVQEANRLKDEFIAVLSHELKNPLNLVHLKAELLLRFPETRELPRVQDAAEAIRRSASAQAQLIDDLRDSSRIKTGKLSLHLAPVDIVDIVASLADAVKEDAEKAGLTIELHLPQSPLVVRADAVRIEQIAWNLMTNAVKFTPAGGNITVRLEQVGNEAHLEVRDTGQGIDPVLLPQVFEMYRQHPAATQRPQAGMGIGLSLVRQLAEMHGGRVTAHSEGQGRGAAFSVRLPIGASASMHVDPAESNDLASLEGLNILVIDDARDSLDALCQLLDLLGLHARGASSAEEGREAAGRESFDLVLTDIHMPDIDGFSVSSLLGSTTGAGTAPVIAMSGDPQPEDEEPLRRAGFSAYLQKPVYFGMLIKAIRKALER
ncbi:chemotaxis protein CheB [Paraburkholderia phenoliruptrix]|uniref:Signal transduction histidine kinase n=2 Tax=Paraburkholderia phenoliruptrix TaxID=252970 RepID=K0DZH7_9BURK|nr:chemotaxis protein CheB [Paraburkholderia phenoliruptrix]AFT90047.1 signal transduction histidine kinase [Paraburkholderia phenoliruptrix BR3459a]CAB4052514.1 Sensor histidine kinase RcsC [Paraburkholderia phenoliruptrix]